MKRCLLILSIAAAIPAFGRQPFYDRTHNSRVLGEPRTYRIFLPADYDASSKSYPVIYYFHGHSDRYTLEKYDNGTDTVPKIVDFVSGHDVIVVSVDGYVAKDYPGFYGGRPWDIDAGGGDLDFGLYFLELVHHIDSTCRTLTDRRHRATSGLSMGGFMSLYLSARFPDVMGSASSFNPGPEFYVGDKGRRVLWRPKDHVSNHAQSMIRLIRASGDYISQYHEEMREAYARAAEVDFEYRQDEYHRHWATSIAESFSFHMRAFANPRLDNIPEVWSHSDAYNSFSVWGYKVDASGNEPGITCLTDVRQGGFRVTTRRWAPDGPPVSGRRLTITTAPLYRPGTEYTVLDLNLDSGSLSRGAATADEAGRVTLTVDGSGHQVSLVGPGTGAQPPVLLPLTSGDVLRLQPARELGLPIRLYNPRGTSLENVKVVLESEYPTVRLIRSTAEIPSLQPGGVADLADRFRVTFTSGAGYFSPARLRLRMTYDGWYEQAINVDVLVIPEILPEPAAVEVLDGRTYTFKVFRQRGNQGGGDIIDRTVTEGKGNGNGVLEPGEEATVWVRLVQGMDAFDKNTWHRCKVYAQSHWITEVADIEEEKQREWTSARERTSLLQLSASVPRGAEIPLLLSSESWSFHFTPDVRYGALPLYQAFQLHTLHLHKFMLRVP